MWVVDAHQEPLKAAILSGIRQELERENTRNEEEDMQAIEFQARIKDGLIEIPERYREQLGEPVRVILLTEEKVAGRNIIDRLLDNPIPVKGFEPLARNEIYER